MLESAKVTGKAGGDLITDFLDLSLSWDAEDYWYSPTGEEIYTSDIYEPSCGAIIIRTREADTRDALGVALWHLFHRIPSELVVRVHRDLPQDRAAFGPRERVDVGATLRELLVNALVFGEFVAEPMKSPEREVRLSGVYWYVAMPAYDKARLALVAGLKDPDPLVRAESGSALAAIVDMRDAETIRVFESMWQERPMKG